MQLTRYKKSDLTEVVKEVDLFCKEINPKFISILKYKFSKPEYLKVANHSFKWKRRTTLKWADSTYSDK